MACACNPSVGIGGQRWMHIESLLPRPECELPVWQEILSQCGEVEGGRGRCGTSSPGPSTWTGTGSCTHTHTSHTYGEEARKRKLSLKALARKSWGPELSSQHPFGKPGDTADPNQRSHWGLWASLRSPRIWDETLPQRTGRVIENTRWSQSLMVTQVQTRHKELYTLRDTHACTHT